MENPEVGRVLAEIADLLELTGGNRIQGARPPPGFPDVDLHAGPIAELRRSRGLGELRAAPSRFSILGSIEGAWRARMGGT